MKRIFILALSFLFAMDCATFANTSTKKKSAKRASSRGNGKNGKRASSARRAAARAVMAKSGTGTNTTSTESSTTTEEEPKEKTKQECAEAYNSCMDRKTLETLMIYEDLYNDYNDMLTDVYSGMVQPAFRCMYSDEVIEMHTKYYYGSALSAPTGTMAARKEVTDDSIDYQTFLRQNAEEVASKKLGPAFLHEDVMKIARIEKKPLIHKEVDIPIVSYKVTALDPAKAYRENKEYCIDPSKNSNLLGCRKVNDDTISAWKNKNPNVEKSCEDYRIYLTEKKVESEEATKKFILGLSTKLSSIIEEYNLKVEADRELEEIKAKEEAERRRKLGLAPKVQGQPGKSSSSKPNDIARGAVAGAATGAAIGSVVPGVGTAVGAVVGGAVGIVANTSVGKSVRKTVKKLKFW